MDASLTYDAAQDDNPVMLFQVHVQSIFKEIASGVSLEMFKQLFGKVLKNRSSLLVKLHNVFVQELYDEMMDEMQLKEFVVEENLDEKFSKLAKLSREGTVGVNAWRPATGDVFQQLRSHDMEAKLKCKKDLEEFVLSKEARIEHLKMKVSSLRLKVRKLDADIAASRKQKEESFFIARRARDNMLSAWLENNQNVRKQSRRDQELS